MHERRQHATLSVTEGSNSLVIKVESQLSTDLFSRPLTLVIKNHKFPSPYKVYDVATGELVEPKLVSGSKLLIQVCINNTYQIRWRDW